MIQLTNWEAALLLQTLRRLDVRPCDLLEMVAGDLLDSLDDNRGMMRRLVRSLEDAAEEHYEPELYSPDCIRGYACPVCGEFWRAEVRRDPTCCTGWRIYILDPMGEAHPSAGSSNAGQIMVECAERPSPTLGLQYARRHFIHVTAED